MRFLHGESLVAASLAATAVVTQSGCCPYHCKGFQMPFSGKNCCAIPSLDYGLEYLLSTLPEPHHALSFGTATFVQGLLMQFPFVRSYCA